MGQGKPQLKFERDNFGNNRCPTDGRARDG